MADFTDWECLSSSMFWTQPSTKNALLGHEAVFVGSGNLTVRWGARIFAKSSAMRLKSTRPVWCVSLNEYVVFDHGPAMACMSNLSLRYRAAKDTNLRRISLGSVLSRRVTNSITSREAAMAVCVWNDMFARACYIPAVALVGVSFSSLSKQPFRRVCFTIPFISPQTRTVKKKRQNWFFLLTLIIFFFQFRYDIIFQRKKKVFPRITKPLCFLLFSSI